MVTISSPNNPVRTQPAASSAVAKTQVSASADAEKSLISQTPSLSSFSLLARQLGAAAAQAQLRDTTLDPQSLGQKASQVLRDLSASLGGVGGRSFDSMSRDQLALITYAEQGEFTVQERMSAWQETARQEQLWRQATSTRALGEYSSTGKITGFFSETLAHFKSLPFIEQAQYPAGYADDLQSKIDRDSSKAPVTVVLAASPMEIVRGLLPEPAFAGLLELTTDARSRADMSVVNDITDDRGRQIMLDRLYGGREPPVMDSTGGLTFTHLCHSSEDFLTKKDRELLSDIYAYVQGKDVDMAYVDRIAWNIGHYRQFGDGRFIGGFNGNSYDLQGWQKTISFTEQDAAIASRVLNGSAINSTRFDQGFLRHILDPSFGAINNSGYFGFMEHVVTKFSAESHNADALENQFATYVPRPREEYYVMTTSSTVRLHLPEPDFITENGVTRLTEKGRVLGYTLEEFTAEAARPHLELVRAKSGLEILRQWHANECPPGPSGRLVSLWEWLGKM
ncbi:MAG TPA: hypothetical protein VF682_19395 [Pseudomonas sp.]